jgi:hypothetical protein
MQSSDISKILTDAIHTLKYRGVSAHIIDQEYINDIGKLAKFTANDVDDLDYFADVDDVQLVKDIKHHVSRASSNYIDYNEYSPQQLHELGAGLLGHSMHHRNENNHYFKTNLENLAEKLAPEYKEDISPAHYGTYGGALTDLKHNPGLLNVFDDDHKAHSNIYHELLHKHHANAHAIVGQLHHHKHAPHVLHLYKNNHAFRNLHEQINVIKTPIFKSRYTDNTEHSKINHMNMMKLARENGDYKSRRKLHENFIKFHK